MSTKALATQIKLTSFSRSALLFYRYILQPDLLEHSCYILQRLLLLFFMEFLLLAITFFFYLAVFQQLLFVEFYPIQLPGLLGCAFGSNNDALPNHLFFFIILSVFIVDSNAASLPITRSLATDPWRINCHIFLCHISNVEYVADIFINISGVIITLTFFQGDGM